MKTLLIISLFAIFALTACAPRSDETTPEMAQSLLKARGFSFNEEDFFKAVKQNDAATVKLFLQAGINPNAQNKAGETALTFAAVNSNEQIVKVLAEKADLNLADKSGSMPLYKALKKENMSNFEVLFEKGASPNSVGTVNKTTNQSVLYVAILLNKPELIKKLIEKGADPDLADNAGSVPLVEHAIHSAPNMEIVNLLLEKSKNVNTQDSIGSTLLMYVAANQKMPRDKQTEFIKALLAKGADKNLKDKEGKTALALAVERKNTEAAALLK